MMRKGDVGGEQPTGAQLTIADLVLANGDPI